MEEPERQATAEAFKLVNGFLGTTLEKRYRNCDLRGHLALDYNGPGSTCSLCYRPITELPKDRGLILMYLSYLAKKAKKGVKILIGERNFGEEVTQWMNGLQGLLVEETLVKGATLRLSQAQSTSSTLPRDQDRQFHT